MNILNFSFRRFRYGYFLKYKKFLLIYEGYDFYKNIVHKL